MNAEEKAISEGLVRVKFKNTWVGTIDELLASHPRISKKVRAIQDELAEALLELEDVGATPVAPDGKVGGNAAALFSINKKSYLLVTKSGKVAHKKMDLDKDFCVIRSFDPDEWSAEYYAFDDKVLPTSDTPLHYYGLQCCHKFDWTERPSVVLHGHALETEEEAKKLDFPISVKETLFSTKEDSDALMELMEEYAYPENKIYIRKGHGFLLYASSVKEAVDVFRAEMKPHIHLV